MAAGALAVIGGTILIIVVAGLIVFGGAYALLNLTLSYLPYFIVLAVAGLIITRLSDGGGITRGEAGLLGTGAGILEGMREDRTEGNETRDRGTQGVNSPQAQRSPSNPDQNNEGSRAQTSRGNEDAVTVNPNNQQGGDNREPQFGQSESVNSGGSTARDSPPDDNSYIRGENNNNNMPGPEGNTEIQLVSQLESEVSQKLELDHHIEELDKEISEALQDIASRLTRDKEIIEILETSENPTEAANRLGQRGTTHEELERLQSDFNEIETDLAHIRKAMSQEDEEISQEEQAERQEEMQTKELNKQVNKLEKLYQRLESMQNTSW